MNDKLPDFVKDHWFHLLSVMVAGILGYAHLTEVQKRVETLERSGPQLIRERLQTVEQKAEFLEHRTSAIESDAKQTAQVISEFRSDLRLVVEWVKDQKRKDNKL